MTPKPSSNVFTPRIENEGVEELVKEHKMLICHSRDRQKFSWITSVARIDIQNIHILP